MICHFIIPLSLHFFVSCDTLLILFDLIDFTSLCLILSFQPVAATEVDIAMKGNKRIRRGGFYFSCFDDDVAGLYTYIFLLFYFCAMP
jgi:hypothetical protein